MTSWGKTTCSEVRFVWFWIPHQAQPKRLSARRSDKRWRDKAAKAYSIPSFRNRESNIWISNCSNWSANERKKHKKTMNLKAFPIRIKLKYYNEQATSAWLEEWTAIFEKKTLHCRQINNVTCVPNVCLESTKRFVIRDALRFSQQTFFGTACMISSRNSKYQLKSTEKSEWFFRDLSPSWSFFVRNILKERIFQHGLTWCFQFENYIYHAHQTTSTSLVELAVFFLTPSLFRSYSVSESLAEAFH